MTSLLWQKASFSNEGANCIYVAANREAINLRESDEPGLILTASRAALRAFMTRAMTKPETEPVTEIETDTVTETMTEKETPLPEPDWQKAAPDDWEGPYIDVAIDEEAGIVRLRESRNPDVVVTTTLAKWDAFVLGVKAGEFDHFVEGAEPG